MTDKTGGAAFPASGHPGMQFVAQEGMTLRDYFAAQAMQGDWAREKCAVVEFAEADVADPYGKAADIYYRMADAMLKARG